MTPQRQAVLDAVHAAGGHPSADEVYEQVRDALPGVGIATVYRSLRLLAEHGRVQAIRLGGDKMTRYDAKAGRHSHLLCDDCGVVVDVEVEMDERLLGTVQRQTGGEVSGYDLQIHGRCAACRRRPDDHRQATDASDARLRAPRNRGKG